MSGREPELLPCPFCGAAMQARDALWPSEGDTDAVIHVQPTECPLTQFSNDTADRSVYEKWNQRAALATIGSGTQDAKDEAYAERNRLVAALAHLYPSGIARTDIPGWEPEWHGCVYIDLPTGQASWHYHDREAHLFADLPQYQGQWDGHDTATKYERVALLQPGTQGRDARRYRRPPAASDLRERAGAIIRRWEDAHTLHWLRQGDDLLIEAIAAEFAAIRAEAKAEGEAEIDRLNRWADGFSDAQLKERRLCEERIREITAERDALALAANRPSPTGREG